tara:strand:- start:581 stop:697 length:117 start_codon:yes stop_codon:yes gene_type:complete
MDSISHPLSNCFFGAFWKDTKNNLAAHGGLVLWQWAKE